MVKAHAHFNTEYVSIIYLTRKHFLYDKNKGYLILFHRWEPPIDGNKEKATIDKPYNKMLLKER